MVLVHTVSGTDTRENGGPGRIRTCNQGIHLPRRFRRESDYLFTRRLRCERELMEGAGRSCLSSRALKPSGSLCTFRRCTAGLAQGCHAAPARVAAEGFPEFIPSTSWLSRTKAPFIDESPALTVVLQAHMSRTRDSSSRPRGRTDIHRSGG